MTKEEKLFSKALLKILNGMNEYRKAHELVYLEPLSKDNVTGNAWFDMCTAFDTLLLGECGQLSETSWRKLLRAMQKEAGFHICKEPPFPDIEGTLLGE